MSGTGQLTYDPVAVLVDVFSNPTLPADLADHFDCREINAMNGLFEAYGIPDTAALWLAHHLSDCDDPPRHG